MGLRNATIATVLGTVVLGLTNAAAADEKKAESAAPAEAEAKAEADATADANAEAQMPPHVVGPKHVELGNNTSIDLPEGMIMFERATAQELLRKMHEPTEGVVGIVFKPESKWTVQIDYRDSGYIEDSDADDLDADDLLDSYRQGTGEQNKVRKEHGMPELTIDGWSEKPRYERAAHHLVWGIAVHSTEGKDVNFFTRILGRNGYLSIDLIDAPERLEASKKEALALLQASHFNPGSTYADHVSSDRSSGIGLRGLVIGAGGVAVASKLGLLAKLGSILVALKKGVILLLAAIGGLFAKIFRRKRDTTSDAGGPPMSPPDGSPPG
jgi:uncharacterized membrane-anchored protein